MKTRRSKGSEQDNTQDEPHSLQLNLPDDIDGDQILQLIPGISLLSPSPEDVIAVYKFLIEQTREVDSLNAQVEESNAASVRKDIELDQALQERDVQIRELESSAQLNATQVEKLRDELTRKETTLSILQAEREALSRSQNASSSEAETLKLLVAEHDREKRDLIGVIDRLRSDDEQRDDEVKSLREGIKQARKEHQELQSQLSESRASETTSKFRIQYLEQQLELAQMTVEATNADINSKSEEFTKYRREKHAELVNLTSQLDSLNATFTATQSSLEAVQQAYSNQSRQLTQSMQKIADVEARLADQTASYRTEIANQTRLIELLESRNEQARARVEEVENEWERMVKTAEEREAKLTGEVDKQRTRGDRLELILEELQSERRQTADDSIAVLEESRALDSTGAPTRERAVFSLSPAAGVAARLQKSGKSFTEVYSEYVKLREELNASQSEERRIRELLSQVLADIEERTPVLSKQRQEFERTKQEADQLAAQLAQTLSERDSLKQHAVDLEKQLQAEKRLVEELDQNGTDLGRQVQHLLRVNAVLENPALDQVPILPAPDIEVLSADQALGSDEIVLYQNLATLQVQNQKLLRIAHSTARALDMREQEFREAMEKEESEAVREANEAIAILEEQLENQSKASTIKLRAYAKQIDFYKSLSSQSHASHSNGDVPDQPEVPLGRSDLRNQFDAFRQESEVDTGRLRDDLAAAQHQVTKTTSELAKAHGTIQFLNERASAQSEAQQLKERDLARIQQRCDDLREQSTKFELAYNHATENLAQVTHDSERLRTECATLRAEKLIWKDIETRLITENKTLTRERSQLADLIGNVQKLHEDLDRANEHDRRRLEGQVQALEAQTQDLRTQLIQEREMVRTVTVHKEMEMKELQARLDQATRDHASSSSALALAEVKQRHLQERLDDTSKQFEAQKAKLSVYERHPSGVDSNGMDSANGLSLPTEAELAQLRADLRTSQIELVQAREHVEQFKGISESNEQAFQQLTATFEALQANSTAQLAAKEEEARHLQEAIGKLQQEIAFTVDRSQELQKTLESERLAFKKEQQAFEIKIVEMSTSAANLSSDGASREAEAGALEERAKDAERKYEDAIKAHAQAIATSDRWKKQLEETQTSLREWRTKADTAESRLTLSETSWNTQKSLLDKEISDITKRSQELTEQNELLHHQLETLGAQAARIRQAAASSTDRELEAANVDSDQQLSDLRSVISFLRKEKEILDLQLEMAKQEGARSKAEVNHLTRILDESRTLLSEERERTSQNATSAAEHAELVERINQLNLLRESNAMLRAENTSTKSLVQELGGQLASLKAELSPLQQELRILQAEVETKDARINQLSKEVDHWQERNRQILSKYDRTDPAELQGLKDRLEQSERRASEAEEANQKRAAEEAEQGSINIFYQLDGMSLILFPIKADKIRKNLQLHRDTLSKRTSQLKALKEETDQQKQALAEELATVKAERDALQLKIDAQIAEEISGLRRQIQTLTDESAVLQASLAQEREKASSLGSSGGPTETEEALSVLQREKKELADAKHQLEEQLAALSSQVVRVESMGTDEIAALIKAKEEAEKQATESKERQTASEDQTKNFRARLQRALQDLKISKEKIELLEKEQTSQASARKALEEQVKQQELALQTASEAQVGIAGSSELAELEARLTAKHLEELESLRQTIATGTAQKPEEPASSAPAHAAELTEAKKELEALQHLVETLKKEKEEAKAQGLEDGRKEMSTKVKLKDSQISKVTKRLQEVEQALAQATNGTYAPRGTSGSGPGVSTAPGTSQPPPGAQSTAVNSASPTTSAPAGRGRGVSLRGAASRGRGTGRGGGPAIETQTSTAAAPTTEAAAAGTSILGAAAKRGRESDGDTGDSLAKRMKPAGGPVILNRPKPVEPNT